MVRCGSKGNIVMFPFMAHGHIIPFLALALKLEQEKGYTITFINTPLNIKNLKPSIPPNSSIKLLEIPFDSTAHGLPPNCENTENLSILEILKLVESSPSLKPGFKELISNLADPPFCIISDMFFGWSAQVAHELGAFHVIFNAGGGYGMAVMHTMWVNLPHKQVDSDEFLLPGFPSGCRFSKKMLPDYLIFADGPWDFGERLFKEWLESDGMIFNTVEEIDHTGLNYFRRQIGCPVWAIGPFSSSVGSNARAGKEAETTLNFCMKWLNVKPSNSVLYVAFGSQSTLTESQTHQLAMALESCGKNFIWVIKPPSSSSSCITSEKQFLPKGFEERIQQSGRGLLLKKWAPQVEILSHKSVGAFLSHCGWNSVLESLTNGVPILAWPMGAEQNFNANLLEEEIGVADFVANGTCEVKSEEIVRKIEVVMSENEKGKGMREKACEVKEIFRVATKRDLKGSSVNAMDEFLNAALLIREKKISQYLEKKCSEQ